MTGTRLMGKRKKLEDKPPVDASGNISSGKTEFSEQVKLREKFKRELQMVAIGVGIPMGDLIERQMWQYVQTMLQIAARGQPIPVPPAPPAVESRSDR